MRQTKGLDETVTKSPQAPLKSKQTNLQTVACIAISASRPSLLSWDPGPVPHRRLSPPAPRMVRCSNESARPFSFGCRSEEAEAESAAAAVEGVSAAGPSAQAIDFAAKAVVDRELPSAALADASAHRAAEVRAATPLVEDVSEAASTAVEVAESGVHRLKQEVCSPRLNPGGSVLWRPWSFLHGVFASAQPCPCATTSCVRKIEPGVVR